MIFDVTISKVSDDYRLSGIITCPGYKPLEFFVLQGPDAEQSIRELIAWTTNLPIRAIGVRFITRRNDNVD